MSHQSPNSHHTSPNIQLKPLLFLISITLLILATAAFIPFRSSDSSSSARYEAPLDYGRIAQADGDVFTEDFTDNDNDWPLLEEDQIGSEINILAGRLWITNALESSILFTTVPVDEPYDDFTLVVDGGSSSQGVFGYAVVFRADEEGNNGYVFSIDPRSRLYRLRMVVDGEWSDILRPRMSPSINTGTQNTIVVEADGKDFTFSVNDDVIARADDETFSSGLILFAATTSSESEVPITVSFDNLEITRGTGGNTAASDSDDADSDEDSDEDTDETAGDAGGGLGEAPESLVECVLIGSSGIEVYPEPDRSSGRVFAAAGQSLFAPHVAGRTADGGWLYFYYFDEGEPMAGWARAIQIPLSDEDYDVIEIINPNNVPDLPRVPYDTCAERPYGTRATPIPDQTPVLVSVTYTGTCADLTFQVTWTDPDGNAAYVDIDGEYQEGIGGAGGTHVSPDWVCDFEACRARFTIVDVDGNRSRTAILDIFC